MEVITKIHAVLNNVKGFEAGYSSKNMREGYMMIEYNGKRYAVKLKEIEEPNDDPVKDINDLQYYL
jgi:hypothetical protein